MTAATPPQNRAHAHGELQALQPYALLGPDARAITISLSCMLLKGRLLRTRGVPLAG